ncbi:MAG: glycosyltransferase family 9 protein [Microscillaceae bacterium]|nr:glycosyltransferase family 9 protein [Microscillaceae bacterium]
MKILVIRFSSIGDVIWVTPALRCLKTQKPNIELHFCTKKAYRDLFSHNPHIDKLHLLDKDLNKLITQLKAEKFDLIIDLHKNLRTFYLKLRLGVKSYSYQKLSFEKWLYVHFRINRLPNCHTADRYLATLQPLGVVPDGKGLELYIPPEQEVPLNYYPKTHQNGFVAVVIGASYFTKKLPLNKLIELCQAIPLPIVLVGGKEDALVASQIVAYFEQNNTSKPMIFDTCGKLSIIQSASVVKRALWVVGHDTGLMHIAACFQKKIYTIWGSTTPNMGLYPYKTDFEVIENNEISCRPCSHLGRKKCPKGHFKCMQDLNFETIKKDVNHFV